MKKNVTKLGKYMSASPVSDAKLTPYSVKDSRGMTIGTFDWYMPWAQYVFSARANAVFSYDCLIELSNFARKISKKKGSNDVKP